MLVFEYAVWFTIPASLRLFGKIYTIIMSAQLYKLGHGDFCLIVNDHEGSNYK